MVNAEHRLKSRIVEAAARGDTFGIATPCITETIFGFGMLPKAKSNRIAWQLVLGQLTIYNIDVIDAEVAAELQISLRRQGWQLKTIDALVAAVTLRYGLTLLTTDNDFERVPGLQRDNWLIAPTGTPTQPLASE